MPIFTMSKQNCIENKTQCSLTNNAAQIKLCFNEFILIIL